MILALLLAHLVAAAVAPVLTRAMDRRAFLVLALVPAASFAWLLPQVLDVTDGGAAATQTVEWIPSLGIALDFAVTPLAGILSLLVTGVGALVLLYCRWYFKQGDPEIWRFSGVLTAFAGAMLGLVLADDLVVMFVFWELTTVLSYLLIGHNPERSANRRAAMAALLVTTFGGLAMLVGILMLWSVTGTLSISAILAAPPSGTVVAVAVALMAVGAVSKSALVPFHFWLPGAMAAPTPVSAYLHAAAMVKAGIFLVALLAPAFAETAFWRPTLLTLGLVTMVVGGLRALRQYDVKLLLAYGTVSQLGFLTAMVGAGTRSAALAGLALVVSHAFFKATLFLVVGIVDRSTGTRDLRELDALGRRMPLLAGVAAIAAASMAGIPPLLGFTAKEAGLAALLDLDADTGATWATLATVAAVVVGSTLTVAYSLRFVWGTFGPAPRECAAREVTRPSLGFLAAPLVLTVPTVVGGFSGHWLTERLSTYADDFPAGSHEPELTLWHGVNLPLLLSALCIAAGVLLFVGRKAVAAAQHAVVDRVWLPDAEKGYQLTVRGVDRLAVETTGRFQRGSLPFYLTTILVTVVVVPGVALVQADGWGSVRAWDTPVQAVIGAIMVAAAVMTVRSRRRLRAVVLVGVTGYGTALMFVVQGAPDLALTQVLVETFMLVTFVLVLRRLSPFFSDRPLTVQRWLRVSVGVLVGTAVSGYALLSSMARTATPISDGFAEPSVSYGGGYNIVNVILVDIRAWDTLGELSVVVVAATGVASLIYLITGRTSRLRPGQAIRAAARPDAPDAGARTPWLRAGRTLASERRSVVFEVVTRLVFHPILVFSVYLMLVGHNAPGGGFAGGLMAGLALMLRYLAGGRHELDEAAPLDAGLVLGIGLVVATLSGLLPTVLGGGVLQSAIVDIPLGFLGELHLVTSVFFDVGVYLVVVGLTLDVLRSLGGGIDRDIEAEREGADTDGTALA